MFARGLILILCLASGGAAHALRCDGVFTLGETAGVRETIIDELAGFYVAITKMNPTDQHLTMPEFKRKLVEAQRELGIDLRADVLVRVSALNNGEARQKKIEAQKEIQREAQRQEINHLVSLRGQVLKANGIESKKVIFFDEETLLAPGKDVLQFIDVTSGQLTGSRPVKGLDGNSSVLTLSPDKRTLYADENGVSRRIDLGAPSAAPLKSVSTQMTTHTQHVSPGGKFLATYGREDMSRITNIIVRKADSLDVVTSIPTHTSYQNPLRFSPEFSPSGKFLLIKDLAGEQKILNLDTGEVTRFPERPSVNWKFWGAPKGFEARFRLWDHMTFLPGPRDQILFMNRGGELIRYDIENQTFEFLSAPALKRPSAPNGWNQEENPPRLQVSPNGQNLLWSYYDGPGLQIRVIDIATGQDHGVPMPNLGKSVRPIATSVERGLVMFGGRNPARSPGKLASIAVLDLDQLQFRSTAINGKDADLPDVPRPGVFAPAGLRAAFGAHEKTDVFAVEP